MTVSHLGIELVLLREEHLEMVRKWRNSSFVRKYMRFQKQITATEQHRWFETIQNVQNAYFVSYLNNTPFGLVNIKDISKTGGTSEAGIFVGVREFDGHPAVFRAVLTITDLAFSIFNINTLRASIHPDNEAALKMNTAIGYRPVKEGKSGFGTFQLIANDYFRASAKFRKPLIKQFGNEMKIKDLPQYMQLSKPTSHLPFSVTYIP